MGGFEDASCFSLAQQYKCSSYCQFSSEVEKHHSATLRHLSPLYRQKSIGTGRCGHVGAPRKVVELGEWEDERV